MNDNVLFINRDKSVIQEFLDAMQDYKFEIDTVDSGLEAAALIKRKRYKVVITGMSLSTFDGNKLIMYLNEHYPETVCIVYTIRVDLAQLRLLVNERNVFRIFLRPANYRGDFYNALKDGFTYFDMKEAEKIKQELLEQKKENAVVNISEMEAVFISWEEEKELFAQFLFPLVRLTVEEYGPELTKARMQYLLNYEEEILSYGLKKDSKPCGNLEEMEVWIQKEFKGEHREIVIQAEDVQGDIDAGFYENVYLVIWLLLKRFEMFSPEYKVTAQIQSFNQNKSVVIVTAVFPYAGWEHTENEKIFQMLSKVTENVIENVSKDTTRVIEGNEVQYRVELRAGGYGRKVLYGQ
ncbi:MAG: response regulator [Lachnospiraceae bacterium]